MNPIMLTSKQAEHYAKQLDLDRSQVLVLYLDVRHRVSRSPRHIHTDPDLVEQYAHNVAERFLRYKSRTIDDEFDGIGIS